MEKEVKVKEKKTEKKQKKAPKTDTSVVYELSFILLSDFNQEEALKETLDIHKVVTESGAEIISFENPILIDLAYTMLKVTTSSRKKYSKGYFGWVKFEVEKDNFLSIKKSIESSPSIVRSLFIKTVAENTLLSGKMNLRKDERFKKPVSDQPETEESVKVEINQEELDKSIDDLVIA
jgi:ribosomal protein S6